MGGDAPRPQPPQVLVGGDAPEPAPRPLPAPPAELEGAGPRAILAWALATFGRRVALCTSFQADGMAILDMAWRLDSGVRVFTIDTGRLPPETYDLMEAVRRRYRLALAVFLPAAEEVEALVAQHGVNLFYDGVPQRLACCEVRKVRPLHAPCRPGGGPQERALVVGERRHEGVRPAPGPHGPRRSALSPSPAPGRQPPVAGLRGAVTTRRQETRLPRLPPIAAKRSTEVTAGTMATTADAAPTAADAVPATGTPPPPPVSSGASSLWPALARWRRFLPGLLLAVAIGLAAVGAEAALRRATGASASAVEALALAILLGVLLRNTFGVPGAAAPGVNLAGKRLLEVAVLLLGASVNVAQVLRAGPRVLLLIGLCVALALLAGRALGRALGLSPTLALLVAVGDAICGNSAIAAVAPVVRADKKDVALAVALTAVVGVGLVLSLPALVPLLHLTQYQYGALVGTTVYAVPQVVAAFPVGAEAGEVATFVKLVRVLALGPVVVACGLLAARQAGGPGGGTRWAPALPWFVTGFLGLMVANSAGAFGALEALWGLPAGAIGGGAKEISRLLMLLAMAALGLGVELAAVTRVGPRVLATVLGSVLLLVALSLSLIALLGL